MVSPVETGNVSMLKIRKKNSRACSGMTKLKVSVFSLIFPFSEEKESSKSGYHLAK